MNPVLNIVVGPSAAFGIVIFLCLILRRASASMRHAICALGMMCAVLVPIASFVLPQVALPILPELKTNDESPLKTTLNHGTAQSSTAEAPVVSSSASPSPAGRDLNGYLRRNIGYYLLSGWTLGFLVVFTRLLLGIRAAARLTRSAKRAEHGWPAGTTDLMWELRIARPLQIVLVRDPFPPMTAGIFRHVVLLPDSATGWSSERLRFVLAHELAHIKRRDGLLLFVSQTVCAIYWFNPLAWYSASRLAVEREHACDDYVLTLTEDRYEYASHLLEIARNFAPAALSIVAIPMVQASRLEKRLQSILDGQKRRRRISRWMAVALTGSAIAVTLGASTVRLTVASHTAAPAALLSVSQPTSMAETSGPRQAEGFDKWLNEEVVYIITDEERRAFERLASDEERARFIEQFWRRRDPTPNTADNEFKEEHDRRIAYANQRFAADVPGWKTDRGHVYIVFGRPDEIESHPKTYDAWTYAHIDGIGNNVFVEFIDRTGRGEYRLSPRSFSELFTKARNEARATPEPDPVQAVTQWYAAFQGSAGTRAQYNGFVGVRFTKAYELLASSLQSTLRLADFEKAYAEVANMKLLQAHLANIDFTLGTAEVFVEEERTVVLSSGVAGAVPAVAWFEGKLRLVKVSDGWRVSGIELASEDIISVNFGGHSPWRNDPIEVARVGVRSRYGVSALPESCVTPQPEPDLSVLDVDVCDDSRFVVRVVKLHSREWRVINIASRR